MKGKRWRWSLAAVVCVGLLAAGLLYWRSSWEGGSQPAGRPQPLDARAVAQGKVIYQANCAACHGAQGEGAPNWREQNPDKTYPPPPHDSTGHTWHHADGLLSRIVRDGGSFLEDPGFKSNMPAFGERLSAEDIRAVITYLKTLWGPHEQAFQAEVSREDPFPP